MRLVDGLSSPHYYFRISSRHRHVHKIDMVPHGTRFQVSPQHDNLRIPNDKQFKYIQLILKYGP